MATATVATELKRNFKFFMDKAVAGECIMVVRPKSSKNVVIISEEEYNNLISIKEEMERLRGKES